MDKFVFEDAVKNDFGNGPIFADKLDFSKSDPVPDWPGDDPVGALSIQGIEYGKTTGNEAIEGIEYGADSGMEIDPAFGLGASSTPIDEGYF